LLANRNMASLEVTRDLLRKKGFDAECVIADISKEDDCVALVNAAVPSFCPSPPVSPIGKPNINAWWLKIVRWISDIPLGHIAP
jgi:hypothetical protein